MIQKLRHYITGEKGVAYIEFALVLPILLLLFVGGLELTRFVSANSKVDKASHGLANYLSTQEDPMTADGDVLDGAFDSLLSPFGTSGAGYRVLELTADIQNEEADGFPLLVEAERFKGAVGATRIGAPNGPVTGANVSNLRIDRNETLVAVETYFTYSSIVPGMANALNALGLAPPNLEGEQLYKRTVIRSRLANFELREGRGQTPEDPPCCGSYCTDEPECACIPGPTCNLDDVSEFPSCTFSGDAICNPPPRACEPNCPESEPGPETCRDRGDCDAGGL